MTPLDWLSRCCVPLLALGLGGLPLLAPAQGHVCPRALQVPVAPIGLGVTVNKGRVGGIYPDLLRGAVAADNCPVNFVVVPRARQEWMYETGQADILLPARRSPRRDRSGIFVPLIQSRAALVSLRDLRTPLHGLDELQQHHELRVAVVRGYDYGDAYQALLKELAAQGRLQEAADPVSLVRTLDAGTADLAIVTPTIVTGALREDEHLKAWLPRLHVTIVEDLPWGDSGVYVSTLSSLTPADRQLLQDLLARVARSGAAWRAFQHYYPEDTLGQTVRAR